MAGELERVRKALRELGKTIKSLQADAAPKSVHKLRTASRRVEAVAAALETADGRSSRRLVKALAPIRKAAGGVRDMDVLKGEARKLARYSQGESLPRLLGHLEEARRRNAGHLQDVLRRRSKPLVDEVKEYSREISRALKHEKHTGGEASAATKEGIHEAAGAVLRELGAWRRFEAENLHEFRLKAKELRYTLELDAEADPELIEALGEVQRVVGDWHDWQQLEVVARQVLTLEEDRALLERVAATVERRYDRAVAAANALRGRYLTAPAANGV